MAVLVFFRFFYNVFARSEVRLFLLQFSSKTHCPICGLPICYSVFVPPCFFFFLGLPTESSDRNLFIFSFFPNGGKMYFFGHLSFRRFFWRGDFPIAAGSMSGRGPFVMIVGVLISRVLPLPRVMEFLFNFLSVCLNPHLHPPPLIQVPFNRLALVFAMFGLV